MDNHSHRILSKHFSYVKQKLLSFANHFDIAQHGDLKGYGREALAAEFLTSHLPDQIDLLTGEIIDTHDNRSGQIDLILQSKYSPKIPLWGNIHLAYADSVIAAIEVKSSLTTQHLNMILDASRKVKALNRSVVLKNGSLALKLDKIPYIVFAYSGVSRDTILKHINNYAVRYKVSLNDFTPDMIVVLDQDFYICRNDGWQFPIVPGGYFRDWQGVGDENLVGLYNYLNNLIKAHISELRVLEINKYFDKSIGKKP